MSLDFLKQIRVEAPVVSKATGGGKKKAWNPLMAWAIRIWKSGAVYPSALLAQRFTLEYGNKPTDKKDPVTGMAFDVIPTDDFKSFVTSTPLLLVNPVMKNAPKTDLFGSTSYNEDGTPKVSVMEQGSTTYGKDTLLPALKKVYGIEPNEEGFIDLVLLGQDGEDANVAFTLPEGKTICHLPKSVTRGEKAGEMTYVRRENPNFYVLYPASLLNNASNGADLQEATAPVAEAAAVAVPV